MTTRPTRPRTLAWALLGGLPLVVLSTDGQPVLVSRGIAEAAALPATYSPQSGPRFTAVLAVAPAERISDARLTASAESPVPPSERVSDARVLLSSRAGTTVTEDRGASVPEPRLASLVTQALRATQPAIPEAAPSAVVAAPAPAPAVPAARPAPTPTPSAATSEAFLAASAALQPAPITASAPALPAPRPGPRCDYTQSGGHNDFYPGRSVSRIYDSLFAAGPAMPHLSGHIPQGLTTWRNWDGAGNTLLLLGMYRPWADSFLVGIDPTTGRHVGSVRVHESHLGGIGVIGNWLITQHTAGPSSEQAVRRYRVDRLRTAMTEAAATGTRPYLESDGDPQRIRAVSFMNVAEGSLWIGRHRSAGVTRMYRYTVDETGTLRTIDGPWKVPPRTQGLLVTPDHFLFASSEGLGEGRLRVYRRAAAKGLGLPVACLWTPSLPQNLTEHQGKVFTAFESGAYRFDRPHLRNRITRLHVTDLTSLLAATDPVAVAARSSRPIDLPKL